MSRVRRMDPMAILLVVPMPGLHRSSHRPRMGAGAKRRGLSMTRGLLGTLRNAAALSPIFVALVTLTLSTSLARADQLEWTQKAGGAGATISASGPYNASDASSNRLHSAVLQSSTVLYATDGGTGCGGSACKLTSGYLTTFPPRPLVQCRATLPTENCVANGWYNDTAFDFRNDRSCASNCAFSKGALHYYKYVFNTSATATEATVDAGTKWSDTALYCPGGACDKTGTTVSQAIGGETSTGYYIHVNTYNGGMKGGRETYGPFKIDQTNPNTPTWSGPTAGDWFRTAFNINIGDSDTGAVQSGVPASGCDVAVLSNAVYTVNDASWTTTGNRTCNSSSSYNATVGAASNCRDRGLNKCEIRVRARDAAGNLSGVASRTFSADWYLDEIHNNVLGDSKGYPVSATDESGTTYIGTYVSTNVTAGSVSTVYLTSSGTDCVSASYTLPDGAAACGSADCGNLVGAPFWSYETTSDYVYVGTDKGWIFKLQNSATGTPDCSTGTNELSLVSGWPIQVPDKCGGANGRQIGTSTVPDDKLVYFGVVDLDCAAGSRNYIMAYEITPTSYDADAGSDGIPDKIVDVTGAGSNMASAPAVKGTWAPGPRYVHIGSDNATGEVYRVRVDTGAVPISAVDCTRDVAGEVQGWMTGSFGNLFFGTMGGAAARFYAIQNTEQVSACSAASGDAYGNMSGFPYTPAGGTDIPRGAKVNYPGPTDEVYFVDNSGRLYCVCQTTGTGCAAAGGNCRNNAGTADAFPIVVDTGVALREPLLDNGTLYVAASNGKVYAVESLYDPSCSANNCDADEPGTVKVSSGYNTSASAATFNLGVTISSTVALRNISGTKKIAVGTDSGRTFYLPVIP